MIEFGKMKFIVIKKYCNSQSKLKTKGEKNLVSEKICSTKKN